MALEEEATIFAFGAMSTVKIFKKIEKILELYVLRKFRDLDVGLIEDDEQSK